MLRSVFCSSIIPKPHLACILLPVSFTYLKGSEAKWSNPRPPWLYPPETKMLSKSVSRAGENSVIWKFEHFGRRGYTILFSFFGHFRPFPTFNCGVDHSGSQPFNYQTNFLMPGVKESEGNVCQCLCSYMHDRGWCQLSPSHSKNLSFEKSIMHTNMYRLYYTSFNSLHHILQLWPGLPDGLHEGTPECLWEEHHNCSMGEQPTQSH